MPGKGSPEFVELLKKCIDVHYKKNHDYANDANPFSNFDRQAEVVSWFSKPIDQAFTSVIAIKIARLAELLSNDTTPNNESIDDNFVDLINYCGLWAAWHIANNKKPKETKSISPREMITLLETQMIKEEPIRTNHPESNIVCNSCGKMFTNIMTIRSKDGNFCSNKCADEYESKKSTRNPV